MKLVWILSLLAGLGLTVYAGGHRSLSPELIGALMEYGFGAAFVALHVLVWRGEGRFFTVLRVLVWAAYAALIGLFVWAYFPRGIIPVLKLLFSNVTLPMAFGLLAVAVASMFRRRKQALLANPSQPVA